MDKIVVVGYSESELKKTEALLIECGMQHALCSHSEKLNAQEVIKTICLANNKNIETGVIQQIKVAPMWDNLLMNLFLANYQQKLWGWADHNAIYLLDYLKKQDDKILFLFMYESPHEAILGQGEDYVGEQKLQQRAQHWLNYNAVLLDFYLKNKDRCLLINTAESRADVLGFVEKLSGQLNLGGENQQISQAQEVDSSVALEEIAFAHKKGRVSARRRKKALQELELKQKVREEISYQAPVLRFSAESSLSDVLEDRVEQSDLRAYFGQLLIDANKDVIALFDKMQNVATIPTSPQQYSTGGKYQHVVELWNEVVGLEAIVAEQDQQLNLRQKKLESLELAKNTLETHYEKQLLETQKNNAERLGKSKQALDALLSEKIEVERKAGWRATKINELIKQCEQITLNQNLAQEQVKNLSQKNKDLEGKLQWFTKKNELAEKVSTHKGGGEDIVLQQENELKRIQLAQLRDELENCYQQINLKKSKSGAVSPTDDNLYGAVERVKQDLPYQLGKTMIEHSRSVNGVVTMPVAIYKQINHFSKRIETLPPLEEYLDRYEADKLKKHLSFKLGVAIVDNLKDSKKWLKIPVDVSKVLVEHKMKAKTK